MAKTNKNNKYIPNELIVDIFKATNKSTTKIKQLEDKLENQIIMKNINGIVKTTKQIFEIYCIFARNLLNSSSICYKICSQNFVKIKEEFKKKKMSAENNPNQNYFINLQNRWNSIDDTFTCCPHKCINTNINNGICLTNGYVNVVNNFTVNYFPTGDIFLDNPITIRGENFFSRAAGASLAYSLFYFEVTLTDIFNMEESSFFIGLHSFDNNDVCLMFNENNFMCKNLGIIPFQYNLSSEDVIGCGVIYPPTANTYEAPHVFFTINGSKFGKTIRPYTPCTDNLLPMVCLDCCSIAANFGQRDFRYDVNNHISHGETFHLDEWTKPN